MSRLLPNAQEGPETDHLYFAPGHGASPPPGLSWWRMPATELAIDDLLQHWRSGDRDAHDALVRAVYPILRAIAQRELGAGNARLTIRATELAHEAYLRLLEQRGGFQDRAHLLAITARVVRRVLIDLVRERQARKRGSELERVSLDPEADHQHPRVDDALDLLSLDAALTRLAQRDAVAAQVVELRYFSGLTNEEVADVLGIGVATVVRHWQFGRAFLHRRLT
jgi:RNA polymerase sigma factor (TIGR02999 family)